MTVFWEPSFNCNLRCAFCYNKKNRPIAECADVDMVIDKLSELKVDGVILAGGEPLLLPNLYHIIKRLSMLGIKCHIITNGTLITDDFISFYRTMGYEEVTVSIDGNEEQHDFVRGKGNYRKALQGIKKSIDSGLRVYTTVTLNKNNIDCMMEVYQELYSLGVFEVYFGRCVPVAAKTSIDDLVNKKELERIWEYYRKMKKMDKKFNIDKRAFYLFLSEGDSIDKCDCMDEQSNFFCIKPNGALSLCPHMNREFANILSDRKEVIYKKMIKCKREIGSLIPQSCICCKYVNVCMGGCRAISYELYNDFSHSDYLCPMIR